MLLDLEPRLPFYFLTFSSCQLSHLRPRIVAPASSVLATLAGGVVAMVVWMAVNGAMAALAVGRFPRLAAWDLLVVDVALFLSMQRFWPVPCSFASSFAPVAGEFLVQKTASALPEFLCAGTTTCPLRPGGVKVHLHALNVKARS